MIPKRYAHVLFGFVLSGMMSFIVSGIATLRTFGVEPGLFALWIGAWVPSWLVAFPVVLVVGPVTRRIVNRLVRED